jgi:DNA repair protein RecO (recombination protein O)
MAIHKTEGIILSSANWSESSQTIHIFTPDLGKITLNVKGSRRINGKRGRPLRFARLEFSCYLKEGSESGYLSDIEPVEVFLFEKDGQLGRLTFASGAIELLNQLLTAHDPQPACYQITLSFLRMTDTIEKKRLPGLFAGYILRLISLLGYRPNLAGCAGCGKATGEIVTGETTDRLLFSVERGGIICDSCRRSMPGENSLIGLSRELHDLLSRLMASSLEEASRIPIGMKDLTQMVEIITTLLRFHAGTVKHLKTFDFLDKLIRAVEANGG